MPRPTQERAGRLVLALVLSVFPPAALAAPAPAAATTIRVALCQAPGDIGPWMGIVGPALVRPLGADDIAGVEIKRGVACGALKVESACMAGTYDPHGKGIACSPQSLLQLVRAAAWYAARRRPQEAYEAFRLRQPSPISDAALKFATGAAPDAALEAQLAKLPHAETPAAGDQTSRTFLLTLNLVFAAIFGHEDGHLYDAAPYCGLATPSLDESSGLFKALGRVQGSGELFKANDPSPTEFTADRCGARRIRQAIDRYKTQLPADEKPDLAFARRAAADIVAIVLLVHDGSAHPRLDPSPVDGYLYPPLRILALAGELDGEDAPRVCGAAAETFVQTTQIDFKAFPGAGILPDDLQAALAPGVPDAWNRKTNWSPQSFGCPELR